MVWGNQNNYYKSPWDDEPQKEMKKNDSYTDIEELFRRSQSSFNSNFDKFKQNDTNPFKMLGLAAAVLFVLWLASGFYTVQEGEEALVVRFGKYQRTATTGLNYHLPTPVEYIIKERVDTLRKEEIGFRTGGKRDYGIDYNPSSAQNVMQESLMLTGDENIVDIHFIVQWKITDLKSYVFNIYNPHETVRSVAESAMREVIGSTPIDKAITDGRFNIEQETKMLLQKVLDFYNSGVDITTLKLLRSDPPSEVIDAFRDVQTAKTDKEREINKALAFHNEILPKARGEASQIQLDSEGYKKEVVERAIGEAGRFDLVLSQYKNSKDVTRKRIYLETMEQVLTGAEKIIMDSQKNTGMVPYLPLSQLNKGR
jgi:modulator of FtsH protease HflK